MIRQVARPKARNHRAWMLLALPATAAAASVLAACGSSGPSSGAGNSHASAAATNLKTAEIGGAAVLTNAKGFTLYSFGPDKSTKSNCNGKCATVWPPVTGSVTGSGIKGTFTTIKRSNGSSQATFDGHPLYTYVADTAPGQTKGNGLNLAGGVWHEVTTSGHAATAHASPSSSSGGVGLGY